ncbi:MAG: 30S ribosomal protein S16 [Nitrospinae bacterium]|nr:30S ribosomal protein S16 [Nitrospinota bacterium]
MAVIIRLRRMGAKKKPVYRIVATDSRRPRDGIYLDAMGQYDPSKSDGQITLDKDRVSHWLGQGAMVSDTVKSIFKKEGIAVGR